MARFVFRAQAALELRRREHEDAQRELARADAERQRLETCVDGVRRAIEGAVQDADRAARSGAVVSQLDWYRFWILRLERDLAAAHDALRAQEAAVAAARAASLAARRRREALERLREKAHAAHVAAEAAAERKVIDELAAQRYARRAADQGA